MVVIELILKRGHGLCAHISSLVIGNNFQLVSIWNHEGIAVAETHTKVWHLIILRHLEVDCGSWRYKLEILGQSQAQIVYQLRFAINSYEIVLSKVAARTELRVHM